MKKQIELRIKSLKKSLSWEESECERDRMRLAEQVSKCTAEQIAHGWLNSLIDDIGRSIEKIKGIQGQIALLEAILNTPEGEEDE